MWGCLSYHAIVVGFLLYTVKDSTNSYRPSQVCIVQKIGNKLTARCHTRIATHVVLKLEMTRYSITIKNHSLAADTGEVYCSFLFLIFVVFIGGHRL